jgi:endonuclease I
MKTILRLALLAFPILAFCQAPSGYYSTAKGSGYTLKTQLYNKIKGHSDKGYSGLWTTYATSDRDNQNERDGSIFDLYSENQTGRDPYNYVLNANQCGTYSVEGNCYNREHMIPQSIFNSAAPMVSDAHFIPPTDGKVNALRSNFPHGNVASASTTTRNGGRLGTSAVAGYSGTVFEPAAAFKGDIARMYFYFATRYENTVASYSYPMFNRTGRQVFNSNFLKMLLQWHINDPVSAREIERNNAIFARQGNRNPFIDNPSYVARIWGTPTAITARLGNDSEDSKEEIVEEIAEEIEFNAYPNPNNGTFYIDFAIENKNITVEIYSMLGQVVYEKSNFTENKLEISNLEKGIYFVKVYNDIVTKNHKIVVE